MQYRPPATKSFSALTEQKPPIVNEEDRILWGSPIWYFFHTIAEKIREDRFPALKEELFQIVVSVCSHLPCPKCSDHATEYMKKINIMTIRSKEDFKMMLFQFHNTVNARKGYAPFTVEELNVKYSNAIVINVIHSFMDTFSKKSKNPALIANQLHKDMTITRLKTWLNEHIGDFVA
jgi:hypothetical protein